MKQHPLLTSLMIILALTALFLVVLSWKTSSIYLTRIVGMLTTLIRKIYRK